jgi:phenylacetic acid degradation protein
VMDNAVVGAGCIVGALCFVPAKMEIPPRKVVVGNPAKIVKDVSDEMLAWKTEGTALYQALPARMHASLRAVEPLRAVPHGRATQLMSYRTWGEVKS